MHFVCSASCSQAFRRDNNIVGKCDYCRNERIVKVVIRVNDKDCYFCSAGCKMLFQQDLKKQWGEYCQSCAYCLSISKTVIVERYGDSDQALCSYDCNLKYNLLKKSHGKVEGGRGVSLKESGDFRITEVSLNSSLFWFHAGAHGRHLLDQKVDHSSFKRKTTLF
uniref:TRASH domain-containing protein n=1 Tax=Labrus bergylta TaxID=56723 RepID=A0A3Q3E9X9_9LABR